MKPPGANGTDERKTVRCPSIRFLECSGHTLWGSTLSSGGLESGNLQSGSLEARATDFGYVRALSRPKEKL